MGLRVYWCIVSSLRFHGVQGVVLGMGFRASGSGGFRGLGV